MSMTHAQNANLTFLGIVAVWRVAMLVSFLRNVAKLGWFTVIIATLGPMALIILTLIFFDSGRYLVMIMAGLDREPRAEDLANQAVLTLGFVSLYAAPLLAIGYIGLILRRLIGRSTDQV
ncbi:hypothetical protein [Parasphingorhabdus litoris]|nr:hypothetical protein [Parasphingorhabdus litoris]